MPQEARNDLLGLWTHGCQANSNEEHTDVYAEEETTGDTTTIGTESAALMQEDGDDHSGDPTVGAAFIKETEFRTSGVRITEIEFTDGDCTTPLLEVEIHGDYFIGDLSEEAEGARDIDVTPRGGHLILHVQELVDAFNEFQMCGITDFELGVEMPLDRFECEEDNGPAAIGSTIYDIFKVEGDELYFGRESGSSDYSSTEQGSEHRSGDTPEDRLNVLSDESEGVRI